MKFKNVKVGQNVKVKSGDKNSGFRTDLEGRLGVIVDVDLEDFHLNVKVDFDTNVNGVATDWGINYWYNHKELKLVKDVD